jgi:LCP family protein required for cell wall assembly
VTEPGSGREQSDPGAGNGSRSRRGSRSNTGPRSGPRSRFDKASGPVLGEKSPTSRREVQQAYRKAHRHPWLRRGSIALAGGLACLLVLGVIVILKLNSNITQIDVSGQLGKRPASSSRVTNLEPMNILVMGSDTRAGLGTSKFGSSKLVVGARPDTTLIVHLSGDRKSALVVSIPRDSMTHAPADCKDPNSPVLDGPIRMWNANQGPACVWRTVEGNTDITIDHFMWLDFNGFRSMIDALGSVKVCTPMAIHDPMSGLVLKAGTSRVSGDQALAFVRVRYNYGRDGSDLLRINRQQAFLSSIAQEATSSKMLLDPVKVLRFLSAVTTSVSTDSGFGINAKREVAQSIVGLKTSQIRFVTVPTEPYRLNKMRVQWTSDAQALWKSIHDDAPLPGSTPPPAPRPGPKPTGTQGPALTVRPDKITVHVINASGVSGLGRQAATDLVTQGFITTRSTTGTRLTKGVIVAYSGRNLQSAHTVVAAFPGATLVRDESAGDFIRVTLGAGSPHVAKVPNRLGTTPLPSHNGTSTSTTPAPTVTIKARTADSNICKA